MSDSRTDDEENTPDDYLNPSSSQLSPSLFSGSQQSFPCNFDSQYLWGIITERDPAGDANISDELIKELEDPNNNSVEATSFTQDNNEHIGHYCSPSTRDQNQINKSSDLENPSGDIVESPDIFSPQQETKLPPLTSQDIRDVLGISEDSASPELFSSIENSASPRLLERDEYLDEERQIEDKLNQLRQNKADHRLAKLLSQGIDPTLKRSLRSSQSPNSSFSSSSPA